MDKIDGRDVGNGMWHASGMTAEKVYEAIEQGVCTAITRLVRDGSDMPSADFFAALAKGVKDAMAEGVKGGMQVAGSAIRRCEDCAEMPDDGTCDKCGDSILTTKDAYVPNR